MHQIDAKMTNNKVTNPNKQSILNYEGFNKTESPGKMSRVNPVMQEPARKYQKAAGETPTKMVAMKGNHQSKARKQLMQMVRLFV